MEYLRDYTMYAAIFGMFSLSWFGWAQESPRASWRKYIGIASGVSLLVCLVGVYLSVMNWHKPSALSEGHSYNTYLIIFYVEIFLCGAGAFVLLKKKLGNYVAPWIAFIVGVHFIALKDVFQDPSLYILAALLILISISSLYVSKRLGVVNSAITGIGAGSVLLVFALLGLVRYLTI